jgi:hypothetical protein
MPVRRGEAALICSVKNIVIEHSFEIATFVFFVGPMILITALYCLIGLTLHNASHVKESKLRLRKSLSGHKREVGQQRVLKMLGESFIFFFEPKFQINIPPHLELQESRKPIGR